MHALARLFRPRQTTALRPNLRLVDQSDLADGDEDEDDVVGPMPSERPEEPDGEADPGEALTPGEAEELEDADEPVEQPAAPGEPAEVPEPAAEGGVDAEPV